MIAPITSMGCQLGTDDPSSGFWDDEELFNAEADIADFPSAPER
jgi:hypothetical protein